MSARLQAPAAGAHIVTDDIHDRVRASDGFSRFGVYLATRLPAIIDDDPNVLTDPVRWAAFAWATATTPVMSPGYASWNGPIEDIQVGWDDGQLLIEAVIRTRPPVDLPGWRGWERDRQGNLVEPRYFSQVALAQVTLRALLAGIKLPHPPRDTQWREGVVAAAKSAVHLVAVTVEELLDPVVVALADPDQPGGLQRILR